MCVNALHGNVSPRIALIDLSIDTFSQYGSNSLSHYPYSIGLCCSLVQRMRCELSLSLLRASTSSTIKTIITRVFGVENSMYLHTILEDNRFAWRTIASKANGAHAIAVLMKQATHCATALSNLQPRGTLETERIAADV